MSASATDRSQELVFVQDFLRELLQALRKQEPVEETNQKEFFQPWFARLKRYWRQFGDLTLRIYPFHFWLDDQVVADEHDDAAGDFPYLLYREGLRSWTFGQEMHEEDAIHIAALLRTFWQQKDDVNLLTFLWKDKPPHFSYEDDDPLAESTVAEGWELEAIVSGLFELDGYDEAQRQNFSPLKKYEGEEQASFQISTTLLSEEEKATIQDLLSNEDEQLPLRASDLFLLVLCHCQEKNDIEPLESWLEPIASSLLAERHWFALSFLTEDLLRISETLPVEIKPFAHGMRDKLLDFLQGRGNFSIVLKRLECLEELSEQERSGLRSYMQILASRVEGQILDKLRESAGGLRRLLLEVLLGKDKELQRWDALIEEFGTDQSFLIDLLTSGRYGGVKLPQRWLLQLVDKRSGALQIEALMTLMDLYPETAQKRAEKLLTITEGAVQRAVVEILCKSGQAGIHILLNYIQSSPFKKLPPQQQESIFRGMGQVDSPTIVDWFEYLLAQKSGWLKGQVDRFKLLAIQGLQADSTGQRWDIMEKSLETGEHSKSVREALQQAFQSRIYSSEFEQYTHEKEQIKGESDE